jgi:hypothetical protein
MYKNRRTPHRYSGVNQRTQRKTYRKPKKEQNRQHKPKREKEREKKVEKETKPGVGHRLTRRARIMTKEERLPPLGPSPHHHEHFRVLRGDDANELGHAHQTINPPYRPSSLLGPNGFT